MNIRVKHIGKLGLPYYRVEPFSDLRYAIDFNNLEQYTKQQLFDMTRPESPLSKKQKAYIWQWEMSNSSRAFMTLGNSILTDNGQFFRFSNVISGSNFDNGFEPLDIE